MGININLYISKSVTKQEWKQVYEESLQLAKAFHLADLKITNIKGIETYCLVSSCECEKPRIWEKDHKEIGWSTVGDYETLRIAEEYFTPRNLIDDNEYDINAGDAILAAISTYEEIEECDIGAEQVYYLWGNKTQGRPYHMFLLAIACMIVSRLEEKAYVGGDITRGQCRKAVALANEHLQRPIELPDQCDMEQLHRRIAKLPFEPKKQINILVYLYLGTKDAKFGEYLRSHFSQDACYEYWKYRFSDSNINTIGFSESLKEYLLWGFDLEKLFNLVNFYNENNQPQYKQFVIKIMDSKLHIEKKNCKDILEIDRENEIPYTVNQLFASFMCSAYKNKKVDRYIPIKNLREILVTGLGEKCDVNHIITEYLRKEALEKPIDLSEEILSTEEELLELQKQDAAEVFQQTMKIRQQKIYEEYDKYDIFLPVELELYKKGNIICPELLESLTKLFEKYTKELEEDTFHLLSRQSPDIQFKCLTQIKQEILLRDKDWENIYHNLENSEESIKRYFIILCFKLSSDNIYDMIKAIVLNDDLYDYLVEIYAVKVKQGLKAND